jgi:hypothetical protein
LGLLSCKNSRENITAVRLTLVYTFRNPCLA